MSMWWSDDEGWIGRDLGLDLLDASRQRISLSQESEQIQRESLGRSMEAIRASLQRIGRTDRLIERLWTGL